MKPRHTEKETAMGVRPASQGAKKDIREELIDWLREAHGMELGLEASLRKVINKDNVSHLVKTAATAHLAETRHHAEAIEAALQTLGSDTSTLKTGTGIIAQAMKGLGSMFASDEQLKDLLDAYSVEHFEIACYTALAAAAEKGGFPEIVKLCRSIIPDEENMAARIRENIPMETVSYLFEAEPVRS